MQSSSRASSRKRSTPRLSLRALSPADRAPIESILRATGVFHEAEIAIALELVDAPAAAGYRFIVAEMERGSESGDSPTDARSAPHAQPAAESRASTSGAVAGYACFGATPLTQGTYDLYWVAVDPKLHGAGVGRALMRATEDAVRAEGGRLLLIETASKPSYDKTRAFYLAWGCSEVARVPDFYAIGDDKVIYARTLARTTEEER